MKCVLLATDGEKIEGASELHRLGYEIELYPTTRDECSLVDSRVDEFTPFIRRHPATAERSHVRSLRASFIRVLEDAAYHGDDLLIFGESDACPQIEAPLLKKIMVRELNNHPDTDVFRLFHHAVWSPSGGPENNGDVHFSPFQTGPVDSNTPYVWGTHAMIIPSSKRKKVADIFRHYRLPTDIALEAANSNGDLIVRVASHNLFYQHGRTKQGRDRKIAVCISSYKRLTELQRQIWSMMSQDYGNIHVFAAVKGINERTFNRLVLPLFKHFIDEGRLTMRIFPNKNQLSNFVDTVRDLDVSGYDLFAKVDDDDIYGRNYFSSVNEFHRFLPDDFSSYFCGTGYYLGQRGGCPFAETGWFSCFGPTMVMGKSAMEKIIQCEREPENINKICPRAGHAGYGFHEDSLMHIAMQETGNTNRAPYIRLKHPGLHMAIQSMNSSVMRGGLLDWEFWHRNGTVSNNINNEELFLEICHPAWNDLVRIFGEKAKRHTREDEARVLLLTPDSLVLKWDNWGTEKFIRQDDGSFMFSSDHIEETD